MNSGQTDVKAALVALIAKIEDARSYAESVLPSLESHNALLIKANVQSAEQALSDLKGPLELDSDLVSEISDIT